MTGKRPTEKTRAIARPVPAPPRLGRGTHNDVSRQAEHAQLSVRDENLAAIAHDLRNPLAVIAIEAAKLEAELTKDAHQRGVRRIADNIGFIERLVEDVLDLAHAEAGRLRLRLELVELSQLVERLIDRAVSSRDRARVTIDVRETMVVRADRSRIERVLENLVANALKFAPGDSPLVLRLEARGTRAVVSVIDDGPGMAPEQARHVFERYWQAEPGRGHGLGLHLCRMIIEAHGGRIGVESAIDRGSRFFFELPMAR